MEQETRNAMEDILSHLEDYLSTQGVKIDSSGMMSCPIPGCDHKHGDRSKSCGFVPHTDRKIIHCFASDLSVNLFHMVQLIEGLPRTDGRFYQQTLPELAKRYGIDYTPKELTPEQEHRMKMEVAYRDAANIVKNGTKYVESYILQRGWNPKDVSRLGVGAVKNYDSFISNMQKLGWKKTYMASIGLIPSDSEDSPIFKEDNLIFTIKNTIGYPIAFVARDPNYQTNNTAKYHNTPTHTLYNKKKTLYLFDEARKNRVGPLWIVEGYADAITLNTKGIERVVALGSAAFTEEHAALLNEDPSVGEVILAFDGDETGAKCVKRALERLASYTKIRCQVCVMPDNEDPDTMAQKGIDTLLNLERISSFRYLLSQGDDLTHKYIEENLIPQIAKQGPIVAQGMIEDIAKESGIDVIKLEEGLEYYLDEYGETRRKQKTTLAKDVAKKLTSDPTNVQIILHSALAHAEKMTESRNDYDPRKVLIDNINETAKEYKEADPSMSGWKMPNLPIFEEKLDGLSRGATMTVIGGLPSVGKSTLSRNIALEIATNNADAMVLYMSVDDSAQNVLTAWAINLAQIDIGNFTRFQSLTATEQNRYDQAWETLRKQENLCVFDVTRGNTLDDLKWHVDFYKKHERDRKIILFVDSLNRVSMSDNDLRQSVMNTAMGIRELSTKYDIHSVIVANLRKSNRSSGRQREERNPDVDMYYRPHPEEISETVHIWYEAELLILCHNQFATASTTQLAWDYLDPKGNSHRMPYLEAYIWKNKTRSTFTSTGFSTQLFFKLHRFQSRIESTDFQSLPTTGAGLTGMIEKGKDALNNWNTDSVDWEVYEQDGN